MNDFSVHIPVKPYDGKDSKKKADYNYRMQLATKIEKYLVSRMDGKNSTVVLYSIIAMEFGCTLDTVRELLMPISGGNNSIKLQR